MGTTPRYGLQYLDREQGANQTRAVLEANARTTEAALTRIQARANDLIALLPAGQTVIGLDTDGVPYFDPAGSVSNPVAVGLDTDGAPYFIDPDPEGI